MLSDSYGIVHILYRAHKDSSVHVRYAALPLAGEGIPSIEWHRSDSSTIKLREFESVPVRLPQNDN